MSHLKERKEKNCLNCYTSLVGRFCHVCGQENLEPKETVWHLITHFFNDITHFDGKFFSTVKYLLLKPGFLAAEYMAGRRASYLNPIRMYVFTSAIFFLILFSFTNPEDALQVEGTPKNQLNGRLPFESVNDWKKDTVDIHRQLTDERFKDKKDSLTEELSTLREEIAAAKQIYGDTSTRKFDSKNVSMMMLEIGSDSLKKAGMPAAAIDSIKSAFRRDSARRIYQGGFMQMMDAGEYSSVAAYDSIQAHRTQEKKDGWFKRSLYHKIIRINEELREDREGFANHFKEHFLHSFPKLLFFSLPFFALILKLVYVRRQKFYYADHGIFAINVYCAVFILLLVVIIFNQIGSTVSWHWVHVLMNILSFFTWLYMFIYLYKAMRRFYGQRRFKTILKFFLVGFLAFFIDVLLILIFVAFSAVSV